MLENCQMEEIPEEADEEHTVANFSDSSHRPSPSLTKEELK
jgi:hypothetical protein